MAACVTGDLEEFHDKVDEAARLIAGLKEGTISPQYVDKKLKDRSEKEREKDRQKEIEEEDKKISPERTEELKEKVKFEQAGGGAGDLVPLVSIDAC